MTPDDHPGNDHTAHPATRATPTPAPVRCPGCRETGLARPGPPPDWPPDRSVAPPAASHLDGTPLCPVPDPREPLPAEPVGAPARLTIWQAVRQSWLIHQDWSVADHLAWLDDEAYDTSSLGGDPAEVVGRWLAEHRRAAPPSQPVDDARVYVVAGGDLVAVFDNPDSASIQHGVMEAAGLDTSVYILSATQWKTVLPLVRIGNPGLVISDTRPGHHSEPS